MPRSITMPQQSDTMTEGTLVKWLKKEGDRYSEGEIVAEIETDKATMEMEGPDEPGVVAALLVNEGQKVPVGSTIAVIAVEGEDPAQVKQGAGAAGAKAKTPTEAAAGGAPSAEALQPKQQPTARGQPPVARAEPEGTPAEHEEATAPPVASTATAQRGGGGDGNGRPRKPEPVEYGAGRHVEAPDAGGNGHAQAASGQVKASPLARRIAESKGIDLSLVRGSGPGGRIVQKDVEEFVARGPRTAPKAREPADRAEPSRAPAPPAGAALPQRVASGKSEVIELSKMRQAIARRLQQSKQTIPHFYETVDIELDSAEALREKLNRTLEPEGVRLSIGDLIAKAVAATLRTQPVLNSTYDGTTLTRFGDVHLGMAVALENGLIVPVLRNIDQMGIREIRVRSKDLVERARAQKLKQDEMSGATFTVSNLGSFGVREFSAIINPPEVGVLAIGAGQKRAVVAEDGSIAARTIMSVTLSADHRVVDGADSARFLATLKQMLEEPGMMVM